MASTLSSNLEVVLYPTRATRSTTSFSRATMGSSFRLLHREEAKGGKFRLTVAWGAEEAFSIPSFPVVSNGIRRQPIRTARLEILTAQLTPSSR